MKTEREAIKEILVNWGVIKDGKFSKDVFDKEVGTLWIKKKTLEYGLDKEGLDECEVVKTEAEPVAENVCAKCGKNPCECEKEQEVNLTEIPAEEVKVDEAPVEEAPVEEAPAEATKKKSSKKK